MAKNLSKLKDHAAAAMAKATARARKSNLGGGGSARCRKHPKHKQSPGVCSLCLREKLSQLGSSNYRSVTTEMGGGSSSSSSVSSPSSYYSSSSASSCSSPCSRPRTLRRKSSISSSVSSLLFFKRRSSGNLLSTSRSLADGFWSKLLVMNRRGKEIVEDTLRRSTSTGDRHSSHNC